MSLLSFWNGAAPLAVLSYYACHPQSYYRTGVPSPDFPGIARFIRGQAVPEALHVHFNGAGGNIGAGKYNDGAKENRMLLALRLAEGMKQAWTATRRHPLSALALGWQTVPVRLPVARHLNATELVRALKTPESHGSIAEAGQLAWLKRCESGQAIDISCLRVGAVRVLHMPGELFVEYQLAAKAMRRDLYVAMAAYGDYGPGYIGTAAAYREGGYETSAGASNVDPKVEQTLMTAMRKLLSEPSATAPAPPPRLDRNNLLICRNARGEVAPVRTVSDWQVRRAAILAAMQEVMGPLPGKEKRCPLDMKVEEETDCGSYDRRLITYASEPGGRVPAYLLIPHAPRSTSRDSRFPAVLCLHPTNADIGHKGIVGLGGKPHRQYAAELADRGFVTLAPSYPLLANYQPDLKALGWQSGTMKAIWDNIRGLDLLESLPFVKRGGFGAIGHSLGGHNAVYTAVFDQRIKVIVSSCGLDSYCDYYGGDPKVWQLEKGWCQTRYMPKLADYAGRLAEIPFDFHEMIGTLAPRVCFINAPLRDSNFKWDSVDRIVAAAAQVYKLHGKPANLTVEHPDCDHDFSDAMREKAYRLLYENLK